MKRLFYFLKNTRIGTFSGTLILMASAVSAGLIVKEKAAESYDYHYVPVMITAKRIVQEIKEEVIEEEKPEFPYYYAPVPIDMDKIKTRGCVADGILSGYGKDTKVSVEMINRSECLYLHRALETWADSPDFQKASRVMSQIEKPGLVYGMFLAEAIKRNATFYYKSGDREFDFRDMCQEDSINPWGEHTCKADLNSREYRKYLKYITRKAMDLGIQSFLFGQVYYQDPDISNSKMPSIIKEMREYAEKNGMDIIIGAQTGNITDEKYLRLFDYIEGGVGIGEDGLVENGPCWSHKQSCWALLWHDRYAKKANHVLLHLDWSGLVFDDMSVFTRMNKVRRQKELEYLYGYFTAKDMGFLMPMMATVNKDDGGCQGPKKRLYSASNSYTCQDEDAINAILNKNIVAQ